MKGSNSFQTPVVLGTESGSRGSRFMCIFIRTRIKIALVSGGKVVFFITFLTVSNEYMSCKFPSDFGFLSTQSSETKSIMDKKYP